MVDFICSQISWLNFNAVKQLLRKKDVKINGERIKVDQSINIGDTVEVYAHQKQMAKIDIVYADDFVLVASKPAGLEVVTEKGDCLLTLLQTQNII